MADAKTLTLMGAAAVTVKHVDAAITVDADGSLTGTLAVNTVDDTAADAVTVLTGTNSTTINALDVLDTVTVNAEAMADGTTLTLTGASQYVVSNLVADLTNTGSGAISVTLDDDSAAVGINVTHDPAVNGSSQFAIMQLAAGSLSGSGDTVTLSGSGDIDFTMTTAQHGMAIGNGSGRGTVGSTTFATTAGSNVITVTSASHGLSTGNNVYLSGLQSTVLADTGLAIEDLQGQHSVTVTDANTFTIALSYDILATATDASTTASISRGIDTVVLTTSGALTGQATVEVYELADAGNVFTQVAGNSTVVGGSGADRIITSGTDTTRGALTIDLSGGDTVTRGTDTVLLKNDAVGNTSNNVLVAGIPQSQVGLGGAWVDQDATAGTGESNANTLNATLALWDGVNAAGTDYAVITGFTPGNGGDRVAYMDGSSGVLIGGFSDNVSLTTNNLSGLAVNSVIEVASSFQINDGENLGAAATMLSQLNNVQDGTYYVVIYDGTSADSNAWIYAATATEGDGFDFADDNGSTNGYDVDTVELIGVMMTVGADNLTSQNFISSFSLV